MSDTPQSQEPTAEPVEIPEQDLEEVSGGRTLPFDPTIIVCPMPEPFPPCFPVDPILVENL